MPSWSAFSFVFGPLVAFIGIGLMVLILKWAFGSRSSLVERSVKQDYEDNYGLMVPVAKPANLIEGEISRQVLLTAGIKANLTNTLDGPRLMVWPSDLLKAKDELKKNPEIFRG